MVAGIALEDIPNTTLDEIALRYRAKQLEVYLHARPLLELHMSKQSAIALGKADDPAELSEKEKAERKSKEPAWEARGMEIKRLLREGLELTLMPEHLQLAYIEMHGALGESVRRYEALPSVSPRLAAAMFGDIREQKFSRGPWMKHVLWQQLDNGVLERLEATANLNNSEGG